MELSSNSMLQTKTATWLRGELFHWDWILKIRNCTGDTSVQIPMQQTLPKVNQVIVSYERVHLWLLLVQFCWSSSPGSFRRVSCQAGLPCNIQAVAIPLYCSFSAVQCTIFCLFFFYVKHKQEKITLNHCQQITCFSKAATAALCNSILLATTLIRKRTCMRNSIFFVILKL